MIFKCRFAYYRIILRHIIIGYNKYNYEEKNFVFSGNAKYGNG